VVLFHQGNFGSTISADAKKDWGQTIDDLARWCHFFVLAANHSCPSVGGALVFTQNGGGVCEISFIFWMTSLIAFLLVFPIKA
tara:strand:- start:3600 stop:3848 length:249 start_codon:yes stop_codon:yes gene_type:complete